VLNGTIIHILDRVIFQIHKFINATHIAQIWCPVDSYDRNKEYIDGIVASLELKK